jgi:periplasmic divalent cation tolerance protein
MPKYIEVRSTTNSEQEADRICAAVINSLLAACAQVAGPIRSTYWWHGKIERADEYLIMMKTTHDMFDDIARVIRENHSYEVPDIVAVSIADGLADYLGWISAETRAAGESA